MAERTQERTLPRGKLPGLTVDSDVASRPANGPQREAEKTKTTSAFITRIIHHFDAKASLEKLDHQFLETAIELMSVDGAALLVRQPNGGGFRSRASLGIVKKNSGRLRPEGLTTFGPIEYHYHNSDSGEDPIGELLSDAT